MRLFASLGFLGVFDALWIMFVRTGEIHSASLALLEKPFPVFFGSVLSALYFCSGLTAFAWLILRALALASSSAALIKASSASSLASSGTVGVGDGCFNLLLSLVFAFLFARACDRLADLLNGVSSFFFSFL